MEAYLCGVLGQAATGQERTVSLQVMRSFGCRFRTENCPMGTTEPHAIEQRYNDLQFGEIIDFYGKRFIASP